MKKSKGLFLLIILLIMMSFLMGCFSSNKDEKYKDFAETAAKQIISKDLKSSSTAVWNEVSYIENNESGQYVVYIDLEATNSFGGYIRSRFFVIVKDINLENETFSYSTTVAYIKCTGKTDEHNLNLLKQLNDYDQKIDSGSNNEEDNKPNINKINVVFENDNVVIQQSSIEKDSQILEAPQVRKENYVFVGWFVGNEKISFPFIASSSVVFTAKWKGVECNYTTNNNNVITNFTIDYGEIVTVEVPIVEGYKFIGWYHGNDKITDELGKGVGAWTYNQKIELTSKVELISYEVKYHTSNNGGKLVYDENSIGATSYNVTVSILNNYSAPEITAVPNKGYRFVKWSDGVKTATRHDTEISSNINDITAEFTLIYNIKFEATVGGNINGNTNQIVDIYSDANAVTAVAENGYRFLGWFSEPSETSFKYSSDITLVANTKTGELRRDKTYYAVFELISYEVKYHTSYNGGKLVYDENSIGATSYNVTVSILNNYSAPEITAVPNKGYRFVKWSDGVKTATRHDTEISSNINDITAEFTLIYNIKFEATVGGNINGNTNQIVDIYSDANAVTAVAENGYRFLGWFSEPSETSFKYSSDITLVANTKTGELRRDKTYYAVFELI